MATATTAAAAAPAAAAARKYDYDLFVIGGGSGGVATSRRAADAGAKVAMAEYQRLGGTCVNVGCVPKKLYMYGSHFRDEMAIASAGYGYTIDAKFDWGVLKAKKDAEILRLNGIYQGMLDKAGVTVYRAKAKILDPHRVSVAAPEGKADGKEQIFTAERILVATGSYSYTPSDVPGIEHAVTSDAFFELNPLPKHVTLVGGGYIATEFAGILHGTGQVQVVQVVRSELLREFDVDLRNDLTGEMKKKGIDVRLHTGITRIEKKGANSFVVHTVDSKTKAESTIETNYIIYATGRIPNTNGLGLEAAGVKLSKKGAVIVDEYSQTNVPSIYAVGDVTDRVMLTPVAIAEGRTLVANLYRGKNIKISYRNIATAVFSQPELGTVGLSEEEAFKTYGANDVDLFRTRFRPMKYTLAGKDEKVMLKIIVQRSTDRVVGVHMLGYGAGEIVQVMGITLTANTTKAQFDTTIALHPSTSEEFVLMYDKVTPHPDTLAALAAAGTAAAGGAAAAAVKK